MTSLGCMKIHSDDTFVLSTGRVFYAFSLGLSLGPEDSPLTFRYGSDGGQDVEDWTAAERQELAEYMSDLWLKWGDTHGPIV